MKAFFDTSVLVPLFIEGHAHHEASYQAVSRIKTNEGACAAHGLTELYSTLTRMPGKERRSPQEAMLLIDTLRSELKVFALTADEYLRCLDANAKLGVAGGAIYDAVLGQTALKSGAQYIYTWNLRHYSRLGPEVAKRLRTP
jgi:predicted nucleic acid-binding protein